MRLHIAVDLDGVCLDFMPSVLKCLKTEFGVDIRPEDIDEWDPHALKQLEVFGPDRTWWDWLRDRDWLWSTFPAIEGAIGGISMMRQSGHFVECVTSKPDWARWITWDWLGKWRPDFDRVTIVPTMGEKRRYTPAQILVDDALMNVLPWVQDTRYPGRVAILYRQPWNRSFEPGDNSSVLPAEGWNEVLRHVDYLASAKEGKQ